MPDASAHVSCRRWRIVVLDQDDEQWPFLHLDVGEAFVEGDLSKWASLRVRASVLRKRYLEMDMDRRWTVRKENHNGTDVIVVRRVS